MQNEIKTNVAASTENKLSDESKTVLGTTETTVTESKPAEPAKPATKAKRKPRKASGKNKTGKPAEKPETSATETRAIKNAESCIERNATNFEKLSGRDDAFLKFYGSVMRKHGGKCTIAQLHAAGTPRGDGSGKTDNPYYDGSALSIDGGAINRARKAGRITDTVNAAGQRVLTATAKAKSLALYNAVKI